MSYEERRAWIYLVTSAVAYMVYVAIVASRVASTPVAHVSYFWVLLWTDVAASVATSIGRTAIHPVASRERRSDIRDKEIYRFGEYVSRWFIVAGAVAGFLMALARWDYFWIANAIYLGFVLWAVGGSTVKLVAYHRGL
jgi:hypothetical protein